MDSIIKTTINIKPHLKKKLYDVSKECDIHMSTIINLLILKVMDKLNNSPDSNPEMFTTVKYQGKYKPLKWDKLHICYEPGVYEVAIDLRKILKKSVSKYIAEAIEEFMGEIIKELCENKEKIIDSDNYFPTYYFASLNHKITTSFTIFWGPPIKKILENYIIE